MNFAGLNLLNCLSFRRITRAYNVPKGSRAFVGSVEKKRTREKRAREMRDLPLEPAENKKKTHAHTRTRIHVKHGFAVSLREYPLYEN